MPPEEILQAAIEKKTLAERAAYLDGACGQDAALRAQVEGLLKAHEEAGSFLEQPLFAPLPTVGQPSAPETPRNQIGPYKLLQQIGKGGMGTVYMAEQTQPVQRTVALKVIKPGMDSRQVIARFEAEQQALGHWQLGRKDEARKWYDRAVEWMDKHADKTEELVRFRAEAAELLGVGHPPSTNAPPKDKLSK